MGRVRRLALIGLLLSWLCSGAVSGAERWVLETRELCESPLPRPRRAMLVFPLVEAGSEAGEIGWGRGLIAVQAMWKSSFGPERVLDTYDFTVVDRYSDQQLLGSGRRVTEKKIEAVCAVMDTENYATGTLEVADDGFVASVTFRGAHGEKEREYRGPRDELHRLPCRMARDVLDYMEVGLTEEQEQHVAEPPLCSTELFDEVASAFHGLVGAGTDQVGSWDCVRTACQTDWVRFRRLVALRHAGTFAQKDDGWDAVREEPGHPALASASARLGYDLLAWKATGTSRAGPAVVLALQSSPYAPEAYGWLAYALDQEGRSDLAEEVLSRLCAVYRGSHIGFLYRGRFMVEYAWGPPRELRARGWDREGAPYLGARFAEAQLYLERALEIEPLCWPAHEELIWAGTGMASANMKASLAHSKRRFDEGREACPTSKRLYEAMMHRVLPLGGGTAKDALEFGRHCVDTDLYMAGIPALLAEVHWWTAHRKTLEDLPGLNDEDLFEGHFLQDWVWEEVSPVLQETIERDRWNCEALCRYLLIAYWRGDAETASRLWRMTRRQTAGQKWVVRDPAIGSREQYEQCSGLVQGGWPDVHTAARYGRGAKVRRLLADGADPARPLPGGWTPLHLAARHGHLDVVQALLGAGAPPDPRADNGQTPFFFAVRSERDAIRDLLAEYDVDPRVKHADGDWMLGRVLRQHDTELCRLLLELGADPNAAGDYGTTPLYDTSSWGWVEAVRMLLDAGADPDKPTAEGYTPLCQAAARGRPQVVHVLLEAGASTGPGTPAGYTPLHNAARAGHSAIAKTLIEAGADVNHNHNVDKWTPLHMAARMNRAPCARALLEAGAEPDLLNIYHWTPMHLAAKYGHQGIVEMLVSGGADLEMRTGHGATALWVAAANGQAQLVRRLVELGAEVDAPRKIGRTPLHGATLRGHRDCVVVLLAEGADADRPDEQGDTALHFAARKGRPRCAELLLQHGAPLGPRNQWDHTPLWEAVENGHQDVAGLLRRHGAEQ